MLGKEKVGDVDCYKMKITYKNGKVASLYLDAKTYYRVKSVTVESSDGTDTEVVNTYADFKKTPEGYVFPFSQTGPSGTISFTKIEINKPVDEKIFTPN